MNLKKELEILDNASCKALSDIKKQRKNKKPASLIQEFFMWCDICKKYIKEALN